MFLKVSFITFYEFYTFSGLTLHCVQEVFFFSRATFAVRCWSALRPTHLRSEPRPRVAKPRQNDDRFFERINPDFRACFSLIKTCPKRETAQETPLAPRVILPTLLCMFALKKVWPSRQKSPFNFLCRSQILKSKSYLQTSLIVY